MGLVVLGASEEKECDVVFLIHFRGVRSSISYCLFDYLVAVVVLVVFIFQIN